MVSYMPSSHCCRPFSLSTFVGMMWLLTISSVGMSPRIGPEVHCPPEQRQIFKEINKVRLVDMIVNQMNVQQLEVFHASSLRATLS